jgi:DNA-binding NarL/FixJ family response regulator
MAKAEGPRRTGLSAESDQSMPIEGATQIKNSQMQAITGSTSTNTCGVLVVEDSTTFRHALVEILRSRFPFVTIAEAQDGGGVWEILSEFSPDLIFMDIRLPDGNGLQLTRRLKMKYPLATVLILTSYDFPEYQEAARLAGADYFLSKGSMSTKKIGDLVESLFQKNGCLWGAGIDATSRGMRTLST